MGSKDRTGQLMTSRDHTRAVWVDLGQWFGCDGSAADGIDLDSLQPAASSGGSEPAAGRRSAW